MSDTDTGSDTEPDFDSTSQAGLEDVPRQAVALRTRELNEDTLQAISASEVDGSHHSALGLPNALIMMVDDEALNIEMTQAFLEEAGYSRFVSTEDSRQAIDLMRREQPSVLLLDLSMPHVDGIQILDAMRDDRALRHIPVIVLTATIAPEVRFKALSSGAMDFLAKPVDPSELALRLRNTLVAAAYRDYLARHDSLTGLPNKMRYRQDAEAAIAAAQADGSTGALLHVGIDGLKAVNDGLGRSTGDQVLQRFAKQLASLVATEAGGDLSSDGRDPTLYRFDGDEFAIIIPRMDDEDSAGAFIGRLIDDATFALRRAGRDLFITGSMGAVLFPVDGSEADDLVTKASLTMRKAKEGGGGRYAFYSPDRATDSAKRRLALGAELRKAVARDEIALLFRKRSDVASQNPVATQAELRWRPSNAIDMAADEVLDLAAQTDAARLLLGWTLERVGEIVGRWRKAGVQVRPVCVPMSLARTPMDDLLHCVKDYVRAGGDPSSLILNLQDLPHGDWDTAGVTSALQALKVDGYKLSLGRLGSANTAVTALRSGLFDEVQIDSALVRTLRSQGPATAFCRGLVQLSHSVGAVCVAPGTEVMANWTTAKDIGVDQYSGPLTGPALPPVEYAVSGLLPRSKA